MPLQAFQFAKEPDIRLVVFGKTVFKIKLSCRHTANRTSIGLMCKDKKNHADLERVISAVLFSHELQPVAANSFVVYPYRKKWETANKLAFYQHGERLKADQYTYTFYIEERCTDGELVARKDIKTREDERSETCKTDQNFAPCSHTQQMNERSQETADYKTSLEPSEEVSPAASSVDPPFPDSETRKKGCSVFEQKRSVMSLRACASFRKVRSEPQPARRENRHSDARRKRRHSVTEYGQKNRHDIEEQDLREFLRFQQLARPVKSEPSGESDEPSTGLVRVFETIVLPIKRLLGQQ